MTLPWARIAQPKPADQAVRERVLGWCAAYADDRDWFIQKTVCWWLRDLSHRDPARVRQWLAAHGERLKPFGLSAQGGDDDNQTRNHAGAGAGRAGPAGARPAGHGR